MKNYPERDPLFIDEMIATIQRNHAEDFAIPAGFDHPSLAEIHRRQPDWSLEMIIPCRLVDTVHAARAAGSVLVSLEPEHAVKADIEKMHAAGLSVLTTLLSVEHGRELLDIGVDFFSPMISRWFARHSIISAGGDRSERLWAKYESSAGPYHFVTTTG